MSMERRTEFDAWVDDEACEYTRRTLAGTVDVTLPLSSGNPYVYIYICVRAERKQTDNNAKCRHT